MGFENHITDVIEKLLPFIALNHDITTISILLILYPLILRLIRYYRNYDGKVKWIISSSSDVFNNRRNRIYTFIGSYFLKMMKKRGISNYTIHTINDIFGDRYDDNCKHPDNILVINDKVNLDIEIGKETYNIDIDTSSDRNDKATIYEIIISTGNIKELNILQKYFLKLYRESKFNEFRDFRIYKYNNDMNNRRDMWIGLTLNTKKTFTNTILTKENYSKLTEDALNFKNSIEKDAEVGRAHKRVYVFEGLPGSGKTSSIHALSNLLQSRVYFLTKKIMETDMYSVINSIPKYSIIAIEDMETMFSDLQISKEIIIAKDDITKNLMELLDGNTILKDQIVIVTTNYIEKFDKRLLRPGRVNIILHFDYINDYQKEILAKLHKKDYNILKKLTDGKQLTVAQFTEEYCSMC